LKEKRNSLHRQKKQREKRELKRRKNYFLPHETRGGVNNIGEGTIVSKERWVHKSLLGGRGRGTFAKYGESFKSWSNDKGTGREESDAE